MTTPLIFINRYTKILNFIIKSKMIRKEGKY